MQKPRARAPLDIPSHRLHQQRIAAGSATDPATVVRWLGAMQAQDYLGSLWAIGLRTPGATEPDIEQAIGARTIVRTWPLRGTLHFVAAEDVRWILQLATPRVLERNAARLKREFGLDEAVYAHSRKALDAALRGGQQLSRDAMYQALEAGGVKTDKQRGLHILWKLAQEGLICLAARAGKQHTFALLDEWLPSQPALDREAAAAELARRYFATRGPATVQDFAWWSGFSPTDAQAALEMVKPHLSRQQQGKHIYWFAPSTKTARANAPLAHLLPAYDEYTVAYKDRSAVLSPTYAKRPDAGNGIFAPVMLLNGQIAGTWRRKVQRDSVVVELNPFRALKRAEKQALGECAERYRRFLGAADLAVRFSSTL